MNVKLPHRKDSAYEIYGLFGSDFFKKLKLDYNFTSDFDFETEFNQFVGRNLIGNLNMLHRKPRLTDQKSRLNLLIKQGKSFLKVLEDIDTYDFQLQRRLNEKLNHKKIKLENAIDCIHAVKVAALLQLKDISPSEGRKKEYWKDALISDLCVVYFLGTGKSVKIFQDRASDEVFSGDFLSFVKECFDELKNNLDQHNEFEEKWYKDLGIKTDSIARAIYKNPKYIALTSGYSICIESAESIAQCELQRKSSSDHNKLFLFKQADNWIVSAIVNQKSVRLNISNEHPLLCELNIESPLRPTVELDIIYIVSEMLKNIADVSV